MIHIALHLLVPLAIAWSTARDAWKSRFAWMLAGMIIDVDHLLADPIYDPGRCSIGFHPLHSAVPVVIYLALAAWPKTRWFGVGLCVHILLDALDCVI